MSDGEALNEQWRAEALADLSKENHAVQHAAEGVRYAACGCLISAAAQDTITALRAELEEQRKRAEQARAEASEYECIHKPRADAAESQLSDLRAAALSSLASIRAAAQPIPAHWKAVKQSTWKGNKQELVRRMSELTEALASALAQPLPVLPETDGG